MIRREILPHLHIYWWIDDNMNIKIQEIIIKSLTLIAMMNTVSIIILVSVSKINDLTLLTILANVVMNISVGFVGALSTDKTSKNNTETNDTVNNYVNTDTQETNTPSNEEDINAGEKS